MPENASGGSSSSSSLLIRSKNPRRCQAENPLKLLSEFAGPALNDFAANEALKVENLAAFVEMSDHWIRGKVALVMQNGILDRIDFEAAKASALVFGINLETQANGEKVALVLPEKKAELKKLLRFLDEDYFQSVLSSTPHLSNSKRRV
ncbi:hypothetical protein [Bradyrhizobium barranii]